MNTVVAIVVIVLVYIFGGAVAYGYRTKIDPWVDDADLTIEMLLWPVWLVLNIIAYIMCLPARFGRWIGELVKRRGE